MFDHVADIYDKSFTHSRIGKWQRRFVMNYVDAILPADRPLSILELNCGTGEDAIYFAKKGHNVIATDLSEDMVRVAKGKVTNFGLNDKVKVFPMDMLDIQSIEFDVKFDLVFSNFGGLNCLNLQDLMKLSDNLVSLMKFEGRMISVIMPKNCLWENLYFTVKLDWEKVFRRSTGKMLPVNVGTHDIPTWYFSPEEISNIFGKNFRKIAQKPIGFTIPPSYMESFFKKKEKTLNILGNIEKRLNGIAGLAPLSDHFLIDLVKV